MHKTWQDSILKLSSHAYLYIAGMLYIFTVFQFEYEIILYAQNLAGLAYRIYQFHAYIS